MNHLFNDRHLLWWVLKAVDANEFDKYGYMLPAMTEENIWQDIGAPDWVRPAIEEKLKIMGLDE